MANCVHRRFDPNQLTVEIDLSRLSFACPEQSFYELRSAGANESGKTDNLPLTNSEADIGEFSARRQSFDAKRLLTIFSRLFLGKLFADFTANHVAHKVFGRDLVNRSGHNVPAIAQDSHAIGDLVNLFQPMRNVDYADAALLELQDRLKESLRFMFGERRGWLIHDDELGAERERPRDFNQLLLGYAQLTNRALWI